MMNPSNLTVGQVSGIIAAVIVLVKFYFPISLPILLLTSLREGKRTVSATAVSWSVIGRELHSSPWPTILRADSSASDGVMPFVKLIKHVSFFTTILIAVAAVVTPLGLYDPVLPASHQTPQLFHYVADTGIFGQGTIRRDGNITWNRICGGIDGLWACPNSTTNITTYSIGNESYYDVKGPIDTKVPQKLIDLFSSGTSALGLSVSSIFDIQWRSYTWSLFNTASGSTYAIAGNTSSYPIGAYRYISSVLLNRKLEAIDGLVVDTVNGGIGFRNHSAPPVTAFGSSWTEDLLFIEPVTTCVDTNLTIDFMLPVNTSQEKSSSLLANLRLVDHGVLNKPEFWMRAYKAAWINNVYTMAFLNVSNIRNSSDPNSPRAFAYLNSTLGKEFPLQYPDGTDAGTAFALKPQFLSVIAYGSFIFGLDRGTQNMTILNMTTHASTIPARGPLYSNPFKVNSTDFDVASELCKGVGGQDFANITNYAAMCGLVLGVPRRKDGVDDLIFMPGSEWTTPMYSCMSATRAVIKKVKFLFNGTDDFRSLQVVKITKKTYADEQSKPLWGVENTRIPLADAKALWGLVSPDAASQAGNLSTLRKESLLLPGYADLGSLSTGYQNLPGVDFPDGSLAYAYQIGETTPPISTHYSGQTSLAMFQRWRNLSATAPSTRKIFNLVWTDLAANAVFGTKGLGALQGGPLRKRDATTPGPTILVTVYHRRIKYRLPYAIPAILVLVMLLGTSLLTCYALLFRQSGPGKMKKYLNATSAGRLMTSAAVGSIEIAEDNATTRSWIKTNGKKLVSVGHGILLPEGQSQVSESGSLLGKKQDGSVNLDDASVCHVMDSGPGITEREAGRMGCLTDGQT